MNIHDLETPALVVDLDVMERNIQRYQDYFDQHGISSRPHIKTHKIPAFAHKQLAAGAIGITCQKLGEVEVMANAGIEDILLYYNVIGRPKLEKLISLSKRCNLKVTVDHPWVAEGISQAANAAGVTINVLAEMGSYNERTGVPTPAGVVELTKQMDSLPGLAVRGLAIYPTGVQNKDQVAEAVAGMQAAGLSTEIISGGGTPVAMQAHLVPGITEHRAGTYIFNDKMLIDAGVATPAECALRVLVTVASLPVPERGVLDGGTKTFSADGGFPIGIVSDYPEARIYKMNEEHGYLDISNCDPRPRIGDRLWVIPNHVCVTVNLHNQVYGVRGETVEGIWPVAARGLVQ